MVIVGGALAFTAIGVYFVWYLLKTGQVRWRARAAKRRLAAKHKSDTENIAAK